MKSKDFPDCFYRVTVKGLFVSNGKVLLIKEPLSLGGQWELPGGGLDFGENPQQGLRREIEEELTLKVTGVSEHPIFAWSSHFENWRNMDWFYSMVLVYRVELDSLEFTPSEECERIQLFSSDELQTLDLFQQIVPLREHFKDSDFL